MIIDINTLEANIPVEIEIDEDFDELFAHASGMLTAKLSGDFIFVKGNLNVNIEFECSRCLKIFEDTLNIKIDEKFFKGALEPVTTKEHQLKKSDFVEELADSEEIDLRDLIYQSIIVNIPSQTLCDENCEGVDKLEDYIKADENTQKIIIPLKINNEENK